MVNGQESRVKSQGKKAKWGARPSQDVERKPLRRKKEKRKRTEQTGQDRVVGRNNGEWASILT